MSTSSYSESDKREIYLHKNYKVVPQHSIDMSWVRDPKHEGYFDDTLAMCEEFGLLDLMKVHQQFIEYYIIQFFATVYFDTDDERTLIWMTKGTEFSATMKEFGALLGYDDKGELEASGWRCHEGDYSSDKKVLKPITMKYGTCGQSAHLVREFEILHRIYRPRFDNAKNCEGKVRTDQYNTRASEE